MNRLTDTLLDPQANGRRYHYLRQSERWIPRDGQPIPISDMDAAWRHNAAAWLLRNAGWWVVTSCAGAFAALGVDPDKATTSELQRIDELETEHDEIFADPAGWMKSMPLYRALIDDLPDNAAELAKHWSDCPVRTDGGACRCWERHISECPKREDINEPCLCRDWSPEWTQ